MATGLYDPGLHLFVDDAEVQDHPGFVRQVQQPARLQADPVLKPDRPWEGESVQAMGGVLFDDCDGLFKMWYRALNSRHFGDAVEGHGNYLCYATSADGVHWDKPELGLVPYEGSKANNIIWPTPGAGEMDPWGIVQEIDEHGQRRHRMGYYQERPADVPRDDTSPEGRSQYMRSILDRHGMYTAESADGIRWTLGERPAVPRAGDAGALGYDPMRRCYLATSRRCGTIADHFVLEWKQYRRVIALATSDDFVHWTPMHTVLKPDDRDHPGDQLYVMPPFVYGNQYLGFLCRYRTEIELGAVELAAARHIRDWQRVGRREAFLAVGPPGSWDSGWVYCALSPPVPRGDALYIWYSGKRHQSHNTKAKAQAAIGLVTLRRDGFAALRCGARGGEVMTEPVRVEGPRLLLNAAVLFGGIRVRVIRDAQVVPGFTPEECHGAEGDDRLDFEITWGEGPRDLTELVGQRVRLHIQADNAANLYSYRFGGA